VPTFLIERAERLTDVSGWASAWPGRPTAGELELASSDAEERQIAEA
jgi:hypothetical protein